MTAKQRSYSIKDVDFLVTASTIIESAIINKTFLKTKRSTWTDSFFDDLKTRIDAATQTHLGVDSAKELRQATQVLSGIQKTALTNLAECKVQIEQDFKKDKIRRDEILNQLGFKSYHTKAKIGDQEALINLLFQFKTNMTAGLKTEITGKGMAPKIIEEIIEYADNLKNANVSQETFKGQRKVITAAGVKEFNEIYDEVIGICRMAAKFYKDKPAIKDQFSFTKVAKTLNAQKLPKLASI